MSATLWMDDLHHFLTLPPMAALAVLLAPAVFAQGEADASAPTLHETLGLPDGMRIEGSLRPRYEALGNPFVAGRSEDDEFLGLQTELRLEFDAAPTLTIGGELLDSRVIAGNETGGAATEIDALEPAQLYLSWRPDDFLAHGARLDLTAGRFTMDIGSRRLVAHANFRNILTSFDGVRAVWTSPDKLIVMLAYSAPVARQPSDAASALDNEVALNRTLAHTRFSVSHLGSPLPFGMRGEAYLLDLDEADGGGVATRDRDLLTAGVRLLRSPNNSQFDFDFEYARQSGSVRATARAPDVTPLDHDAEMAHAEIGFSFDAPWSPRLALAYDFASGDRSPTDGDNQRFDPLFGDRAFEFGPTSIYGFVSRTNLSSPGIRLEVRPGGGSDGYVMLRDVRLASATDSLANSSVRDPAGLSGDHAGLQIEGRYRHWLVQDALRLSVGAATVLTGSFLKDAPNATRQGDPLYGYTELTWAF
jgi:hypothetical protein